MLCITTCNLYGGGFHDSYMIPKGTVMRVVGMSGYSVDLVSVRNKYHKLRLTDNEFTDPSYVYEIDGGV